MDDWSQRIKAAGAVGVAVAASCAVFATACAGSGGDKAGGREADANALGTPVALTLVTGDGAWAPAFAAAAARLSGGAIRIEIRVQRTAQANYERYTVEDVRAGKAQLGSVGARVWDTLGVTSFQALVAPFLVDSLALQRRVLASSLAVRMLEGMDRAGLIGLAVLPGPLRRPLGLSRPLVGLHDYEGMTIGIRYGRVARTAFQALGATSKGYRMGSLAGFDGAELDANTIVVNGYDADARALTANVVLWSRPQTIFMNRAAFDRLNPAQQKVLRRAGPEALAPELARLEREQREALAVLCDRHPSLLVTASAADQAALRRAVQPVFADLERDARTKESISAIRKMRAETATGDPLQCPKRSGRSKGDPSRLDGVWQAKTDRDELLAAGAQAHEADQQSGRGTLELKDGGWVARRENGNVWRGTYVLDADIVRLTVATCGPSYICTVGSTHEYRWSVYRQALSLERVGPVHPFYWGLLAEPLSRGN